MSEMSFKRGKYVAIGVLLLTVVGLVVAAVVLQPTIVERWYLWELHSGERVAEERAAGRPGGIRSARAVPKLLELLRADAPMQLSVQSLPTGDFSMQVPYAADALVGIGAPSVPGLTGLLKDGHPAVRGYATHALGSIGQEARSSVPALQLLTDDEYEGVRTEAIRALRNIQDR